MPQVPGVSGGIQSRGRAALEPAHPSAEQRAGLGPTAAQCQTARQLPGSCRNTTVSGTQTAGLTPSWEQGWEVSPLCGNWLLPWSGLPPPAEAPKGREAAGPLLCPRGNQGR